MRLIIDAGSTKMGWILMEGHEVKAHFVTKGFNPNYSDRQDLVETCRGASLPNEIQSIYYYGTGCGNEQNCQTIKEVFQSRFPHAEIHVTHDLMAVCHAVLGHEKGVACILGMHVFMMAMTLAKEPFLWAISLAMKVAACTSAGKW